MFVEVHVSENDLSTIAEIALDLGASTVRLSNANGKDVMMCDFEDKDAAVDLCMLVDSARIVHE